MNRYLFLILLFSPLVFAGELDVACQAMCMLDPLNIGYRITMFGNCECVAQKTEEDYEFDEMEKESQKGVEETENAGMVSNGKFSPNDLGIKENEN